MMALLIRITHSSTCLDLGLQGDLTCAKCLHYKDLSRKPKNRGSSRRTCCEKPWDMKWCLHREHRRRETHKRIVSFLREANTQYDSGDEEAEDEQPASVEETAEEAATMAKTPPAASKHGSATPLSPKEVEHMMASAVKAFLEESNDSPDSFFGAAELLPAFEALQQARDDENDDGDDETTKSPPRKKTRRYTTSFEAQTAGKHIVQDVPAQFTVIFKGLLKKMEAEAQEGRRLKQALSKKKFMWGEDARFLLGVGLSEVPGVSHYALEQMLPLVYAALFVEANVSFDPETFARALPSNGTLATIIEQTAADCLTVQQKEVQEALLLHLGADKGNRKGVDHFKMPQLELNTL
jgi:hypothetical protein